MDKKVITNLTILFVSEYTSCYNWSQADEAFSIISLYKQNWDFYIEYSLLYSITGDETFYQSLILQQQMLSGEQDWDDTPKGSQITNYPTGKHSITDLLSKINMNGKEKDLFNKISTSISEMAIVFSQNLSNHGIVI